jgi:hypothetical protein
MAFDFTFVVGVDRRELPAQEHLALGIVDFGHGRVPEIAGDLDRAGAAQVGDAEDYGQRRRQDSRCRE